MLHKEREWLNQRQQNTLGAVNIAASARTKKTTCAFMTGREQGVRSSMRF
jgi:hypothetical protein